MAASSAGSVAGTGSVVSADRVVRRSCLALAVACWARWRSSLPNVDRCFATSTPIGWLDTPWEHDVGRTPKLVNRALVKQSVGRKSVEQALPAKLTPVAGRPVPTVEGSDYPVNRPQWFAAVRTTRRRRPVRQACGRAPPPRSIGDPLLARGAS